MSQTIVSTPSVRQTAFDIVHRLRAARSQFEVYTELRATGVIFGYDAFIITGLPRNAHENLADCKLVSGWPTAWEQHYQSSRFVHVDPVIAHIRGTADPFLWQEAVEATGAVRGMEVMHEARSFGLAEGLCVPFHHIDGSEAGVSFGGGQIHLSADERAGLHLVAIYAMSAAKAIARRHSDGTDNEPPLAPLSDREIECLKWASAGKTAWETSVILAISMRTVEQHLASASRKLRVVSRTQCVAEALRRGIID